MQREYDSYDSMTLTFNLKLKNYMTVSYLRSDTESVSVSVMRSVIKCQYVRLKLGECEVS